MGFSGMDHLLRAQTVLGDLEKWDFEKTPVTAGALAASAYYDFYEAGPLPAANAFPVGSKAFKAVRANSGTPQAGGVNINANAFTVPSNSKTRHLTYLEHNGGNVASTTGDLILLDLVGFYCDFDLAAGAGTYATGTGVGVADVTRYTTGKNLFMYLVAQVVFTGTAPSFQINYTTGGLASVSTAALALINTCVKGRVCTTTYFKVPFGSNDPTVVAVRSVTLAGGAAPTGKVAIMIAKEIGRVTNGTAQLSTSKSFVNPAGEFSAPGWDSDSVPAYVWKTTGAPTTPSIAGQFQTTAGYAT